MARSSRAPTLDHTAGQADDGDLPSVPAEFVVTGTVQLSEAGAKTLRAELAEDAPSPPASSKLRALLRGVRR